jgi:putative intracellular protease/amidase
VNVVVGRELVTAQQPFSSDAFAEAFVKKLSARSIPSAGAGR